MPTFKLTYSTMFAPPRELHDRFDAAVAALGGAFGKEHPLHIGGKEVFAPRMLEKYDPADHRRLLGKFSLATEADADAAVAAARAASPGWRATPWQDRMQVMRKASRIVEERAYDIAAALSFEVGKNRMEALGEVGEVVDFFSLFADQMEQNGAYDRPLPNDPVAGFTSTNRSVLKPYGVWAVIVPFNFPFALAGGPVAAALATGNTVVLKGAVDTPWSGVLLAECLRDAGVPAGAFNYLLGDGATIGQRLVEHDGVDGITFTGSREVGMRILRAQAARAYPRPSICEMGGKNAVLVTAHGNLDDATQGIVRSAFGLTGQKCSALSRIYVESPVYQHLVDKIREAMAKIAVGTPQEERHWMGPIASQAAFDRYGRYVAALSRDGAVVLAGGRQRWRDDLQHGWFCEPTLARAPLDHALWQQEMFAPIVMIAPVASKEEGMELVNDGEFGLTAGFYGSPHETEWFYDNVEAGVAYSNRPQGATTGAWPGYQAFGGWKGSGSTGKALASFYYLGQYMREQSQTRVQR
ncbi:MAG: aldehyde dehydrogenase family protein [Burkholderiales bacterium]|nr:aldehyde dehydrogenase family protein [Burkholderiales bacterium]